MIRYALLAAVMCLVLDVNSQHVHDVEQIHSRAETGSVAPRVPEDSRAFLGFSHVIATTVVIDPVATTFDAITFQLPDAIVRTVAVENASAKEFSRGLKCGDEIRITYSEPVAAEVRLAS